MLNSGKRKADMLITTSSDFTPAVATDILSACGVLRSGIVTTVIADMDSSQRGFISNVATFQLTYSDGAGDGVPRRLFLKVTKPDLHPEYRQVGQHEVTFYSSILPAAHEL